MSQHSSSSTLTFSTPHCRKFRHLCEPEISSMQLLLRGFRIDPGASKSKEEVRRRYHSIEGVRTSLHGAGQQPFSKSAVIEFSFLTFQTHQKTSFNSALPTSLSSLFIPLHPTSFSFPPFSQSTNSLDSLTFFPLSHSLQLCTSATSSSRLFLSSPSFLRQTHSSGSIPTSLA